MKSRRSRFFAACFTLFCVLFAQWAVAHHAARGLAVFAGVGHNTGHEVTAAAHEGDCHNPVAASKALCKQHCESDRQSVAHGFDASAFAAFTVAYALSPPALTPPRIKALAVIPADLVPHPPPLSRSANLRI
jgi:hypothetical protein